MVLFTQEVIANQSRSGRMQTGGNNHGSSKLYVGNLASDVGDEDLQEFFEDMGVVASSIVKSVVKKGFAFVEFVNQAAADMAMDLCNGKPLMNTLVRIEPAIRNEQFASKSKKLVQLLFANCSPTMSGEHVKNLIQESNISAVNVEGVRSAIPGSLAYVIRVTTMKHAQQIVSEWNNKIVSGSRMQIKILEDSFSDGAGGDTYQNQDNQFLQGQTSSCVLRSAAFAVGSGSGVSEDERFVSDEEGSIQLPIRILIPNDFVGAIIGRGGSTIRAISKGTGARIDIYRNLNRTFDMPEKPITILGSQEKTSQACKKIMEIMAQEAVHHRDRDQHGDIALKIFVPNSVVGRIIGKAGAVIKQLMEDTQTKIHIANQPDYLEHQLGIVRSNRIVTIRGSIEGMSQAEAIISAKLREAYIDGKVHDRDLEFSNVSNPLGSLHFESQMSSYNPYYPPFAGSTFASQGGTIQNQMTGSRYPLPIPRGTFPLTLNSSHDGISLSRPETSYMYVPDDSVGALIGRNGSSIREIIHSSGASIKVLEGVIFLNDFPFRRVVIHGGVDSLLLAEYLIYHRVVDEKHSSCSIEDPQLTIEMTVPTDVVGRLIGKGGSNIREIQRQNFCHIKFLTEPDMSIPPPQEGETYVRITGTAHGFLSAQKKIRALLVKAMNKAFSSSNNEGNGSGSRNESPEEECNTAPTIANTSQTEESNETQPQD